MRGAENADGPARYARRGRHLPDRQRRRGLLSPVPQPGDIEVSKLVYSSFHGTDLEQQLRTRGIDTLVMTGLTTECCVDSTTRDAFHRDFHTFVVSDACAAYEPDLHAHALKALAANTSLLVTTDAVMAAWSA
ncbi:cysteine hydrolase family protein [Novosphingobium resinovorum]